MLTYSIVFQFRLGTRVVILRNVLLADVDTSCRGELKWSRRFWWALYFMLCTIFYDHSLD